MVERAGATTVSAVMLHEIVRKLPDGALVNLTEDAATGRLTIAAGRSTFSLATLPREDFPVMATVGIFLAISRPPPGAAPAVRQGEIRDFDRGNPLLPERRLYACRDR